MTVRIALIFLCLSGLSFAGQAHAQVWGQFGGQSCRTPDKAPEIRVNVMAEQPRIDHTVSRGQLKSFNVATVSPYDNSSNNVHVNGIMRGAISVETQSAVGWQHATNGGENCLWFDHIVVTVKLNPTIYIASEIPNSSCLYREVLNHEFQHFNIDFGIAKDFQSYLEAQLNNFLAHTGVIGPYDANSWSAPKEAMVKQMEDLIRTANDAMNAERLKRQAMLDTKEEYERVAKLCPGDKGVM